MTEPIIIDTADGPIGVESSEHVPDGQAYVLDQRKALGDFYDPKIHGAPRKLLVRDAEALMARLREAAGG